MNWVGSIANVVFPLTHCASASYALTLVFIKQIEALPVSLYWFYYIGEIGMFLLLLISAFMLLDAILRIKRTVIATNL